MYLSFTCYTAKYRLILVNRVVLNGLSYMELWRVQFKWDALSSWFVWMKFVIQKTVYSSVVYSNFLFASPINHVTLWLIYMNEVRCVDVSFIKFIHYKKYIVFVPGRFYSDLNWNYIISSVIYFKRFKKMMT